MRHDAGAGINVQFVGYSTTEGHTLYKIKVTSSDGQTWNLQKRYSEFRTLHDQLRPRHGDAMPQVPGRRFFGNQDPTFIQARQVQLQQYLEAVLQLERDLSTPALHQFLGGPPQQGEKNQDTRYREITEKLETQLLNLSLPPQPLPKGEIEQRIQKYGNALRLHVLSQPVDPIYLRALGFDADPIPLCPTNGERFDALSAPTGTPDDSEALTKLLNGIQEVLRPENIKANPDALTSAFPATSFSSA
mmetsp:Transcript_24900/g.55274  ORF Transcript_24900/g.55274 Transcript_24900/m.55274 type:complete len:246 (+) Transcript_24900:80-817(+)